MGGNLAMVTKIYKFHNVSPILPMKVLLRLSEHDDVIETRTIKIYPPIPSQSFLANLIPG